MADYNPPLKDMQFVIHALSGIENVLDYDCYADFDLDVIEQVVTEASRFATEVLGPINQTGDAEGCRVENGGVVIPPAFADAYRQFLANGWQGLVVSPDFGGMGFPDAAGAAAVEAWQSACLAFSLQPMLTAGAIIAIEAHASEDLKQSYLPSMASGAWTGTMNLTEPQAGSDLAAIVTKAIPEGDHYRNSGLKKYSSHGAIRRFPDNVVHLVLARIQGAPDGVRGISMFLVPKFLLNDDGSIGDKNDVFVTSIEHKLGIHGSPTCVMNFGENDGAIGYLIGEENKGLAAMFTMMNHARIEVGVQGLAVSERAYQQARDYALQRKQGRAPGVEGRATIVHHADVRRMLLVMKSQIEAMRALAYATAGVHDRAHNADDVKDRESAERQLAVLTPVVKGWMTELAQEITSLGVQIHGGMGYVEETGAAQHLRDARILTIYEGTTGNSGDRFQPDARYSRTKVRKSQN